MVPAFFWNNLRGNRRPLKISEYLLAMCQWNFAKNIHNFA